MCVGKRETIGWLLGLSLSVMLLNTTQAIAGQTSSWAEQMFEKRSHDFGVVARASDVNYRFKITNPLETPVHIASVRTTCGCSAAQPSQNTLASGETAYIEVKMNTLRFTRRKDSNLVVTFDTPYYAEIYLPITAYIRTDVVLDPGSAAFGAVDQGSESERKISVAYAGRNEWTIKEVRTQNEFVQARVVETFRGGGRVNYDLYVTLKPTAPAGALRQQITLVTDDQNNPYVPVLVEAKVEADITVTPAVVSLGMLQPGQSKTVNIVVKAKKPFEIEKIEADSDQPVFHARLPKSSQMVHLFPLTVTSPNTPGTFTQTFTLTIVGHPNPVTFKAYGKILEPGT